MALPTAEEVTNFYLYGTKTRPQDLLDPSLLLPRAGGTISIDVNDYMTSGAGRYADVADFEFIAKFFNPITHISPGSYTKDDIFKLFGYRDPVTGQNLKDASYTVNQVYLDSGSSDYAERVYIWGTTGFKVSDNVEFIVNPDGSREIRNFSIEPTRDEDFDFAGGATSQLGNAALEPVIDPSGIGSTVKLIFTGTVNKQTVLTEANYSAAVKSNKEASKLDAARAPWAIEDLKNKLFSNGSMPIRFLDADGRPIIYGTSSGDSLQGTITPTGINISVDEYNVAGWLGSIFDFGLDNNLSEYISNGIAYVAGKGNDTVTGTDNNDALYGEEGSDLLDGATGSDKLYGGMGDDIYIVDNASDEVFEGKNEGKDLVKSGVTHTLAADVEDLELSTRTEIFIHN